MKMIANWIKSPVDGGVSALEFRRDVKLVKPLKRATVMATAMGIYAFYLNESRVGEGVLTPGWTSYRHRVQYQTYDITSLLQEENRFSFGVGQGWAVGCIGYARTNHFYADHTSLAVHILLEYTDGSREQILTDDAWAVYTTPVTSSEIYHGETVDHTAPITYLGQAEEDTVKTKLLPQIGEWVREQEAIAPIALITTPRGERVLDFGQNMAGYVKLRIRANRGDRVVLHHAEVLDAQGNFYTENYRGAMNENIYICSGGEDLFYPTYSFQGFRYVRLTEYPHEEIDLFSFTAVAVYSDMEQVGRILTGNPRINQLCHNVLWGHRSNYLDVPTDCPQRDERLGWTGDAQIFFRAATYQYDVERFFAKWMGDVALEQGRDGSVMGIVPNCLKHGMKVSSAWGDAATIIPWGLYLAYGNKQLLKKQYSIMKKWVEYQHHAGPEEFLWLEGDHFGDWLAMDKGPDEYSGATPCGYLASIFYAHSTSLLIKAGEALGEDMTAYRALYQSIVKAIRGRYMREGDLYLIPDEPEKAKEAETLKTQTAYVLALYFDICTEEEKPVYAERLCRMIRENGDRMTTGFVGTPYLLHVLSSTGHCDLAYTLLLQEKNPSWLYSVCHGATTMWEHWNSQKEDGSFWSTNMNSFNHYAYGAVLDWIWGVAIGVSPRESAPGYEEYDLCPHPHPALGFIEGSLKTRHGEIGVHWYYKDDKVYYEFTVPAGCCAHMTLPDGKREILRGGKYHFVV